jgi:hypothetical protein
MKTVNYGWQQRLRELYDKAQVKYGNENRKVETMFTPREVGVLRRSARSRWSFTITPKIPPISTGRRRY